MAHILDLDKVEGLRRNGADFIGRCPICALENRDKSKNHLSILSSGVYNCIADSAHNKSIYQLLGIGSSGIIEDRPIEEPKAEVIKDWPISLLEKLIKDYSYFEGRGISASTQKHFHIGVALSGQMNQRAIIPIISDNKNKIIGFTGRSLIKDVKPKWRHLGSKTHWKLIGDEKAVSNTKTIIIVEGPADILALYECGIKNTICLFGVTISSKQLGFLIKTNPERIIIALNNEASNIGNAASEKLKKILLSYFSEERITIGLPEGAKDFCELLETGRRNLIESWSEKYLKIT